MRIKYNRILIRAITRDLLFLVFFLLEVFSCIVVMLSLKLNLKNISRFYSLSKETEKMKILFFSKWIRVTLSLHSSTKTIENILTMYIHFEDKN